jgi:hypothetical protein
MGHKKKVHHGLRLLKDKAGKMASAPEARPGNIRIERDGFVADIIISRRDGSPDLYHYVIQPAGSREIVHWGQEVSLQRAQECVDEFIDDYQQLRKIR